jgi:hypothetical protein
LTQQITAFATTQSDMGVQVLVKRARGSGGILDLMQTAAPVAPSFLPDVTLLDLTEIPAAAQAGLLRPLNGLVPDETLADLFPFATSVGLFEGQWLATSTAWTWSTWLTTVTRSSPLTLGRSDVRVTTLSFPAGAIGGMPSDALMAQHTVAGGRGWMTAPTIAGRGSIDTDAEPIEGCAAVRPGNGPAP